MRASFCACICLHGSQSLKAASVTPLAAVNAPAAAVASKGIHATLHATAAAIAPTASKHSAIAPKIPTASLLVFAALIFDVKSLS